MLQPHLSGLIFWLGVLDTLAERGKLRGLRWGRGSLGPLLMGAGAYGRPNITSLLTTLLPALCLQTGLATLANQKLDPKQQLQPGEHRDRSIVALDIPGAYGAIPALHITPKGGSNAAVCIAHGSGCDKTFYAWRLTSTLLAQGFAVLLIDLDGHGASPRPQAYPAIIESVAGPARWLAERYAQISILGMSLGGAVAARAVATGAPCNALILWETPPELRLDARAYRRVQIREALRIARPTLLHLFRDSTLYHLIRSWRTSGIRANIGTWDLFDALDVVGSLRSLRTQTTRPPLLLIYGGRDAVVPQAAAQRVIAATQGWAQYQHLPRATHLSLPIEPATISISSAWLRERVRVEC